MTLRWYDNVVCAVFAVFIAGDLLSLNILGLAIWTIGFINYYGMRRDTDVQ